MRCPRPASRAAAILAAVLCAAVAAAAPASAADPPPTPYPGVPDVTPVAPGAQGGVLPAAPAPSAVPTPVPVPPPAGVSPSAPGAQGGVVPPAAAPVVPAPGAPAAPAPGGVSPVAPGAQAGVAAARAPGDVDVAADNGGGSPSCRNGVACEGTANSIAHAEPVDAYGLDYNDDVGFSVGDVVGVAVQAVGAFLWWITLHLFDAVLLVLDWAFNLDIVLDSLTSIQKSLGDMQAALGGDDWLLLGIAVAGLWGTWNGLVRQRTVETMSGLALTVVLIVLAMAIVKNPDGTVGEVSRWSNESSLAALSAVSTGGVDGLQNFAEANKRLWDVVVGEPWCVLQFGSIENCQKDWLQHPSNSQERIDLATAARGSNPELVALQEPSGALSRFGVLALVIPGIVGAICLLVYIGGRLVLASIMTLFFLLLLAPMMIAPCFGEGGRTMFLSFLKRGGFAVVSKFIYAFFLTVVLLVATAIASLNPNEVGWYAKWLLLLVFWWGILVNRDQLLSFMDDGAGRNGMGLMRAYFGYRAIRDIGRDVTALPRAAVSGGVRRSSRALMHRNSRHAEASRNVANDMLRRQTADRLRQRGAATQADPEAAKGRLAAIDEELASNAEAQRSNQRQQEERRQEKGQPQGGSRARSTAANEAGKRPPVQESLEDLQRQETGLKSRAAALQAERTSLQDRAGEAGRRRPPLAPDRDAQPSSREIDAEIDRSRKLDRRSLTPEDKRYQDLIRHADGDLGPVERRAAAANGPHGSNHRDLKVARRQVRRADRTAGARRRRVR